MNVRMGLPFHDTGLTGARLYVVGFPDGSVKVGRSVVVDRRFRIYARANANRAWASEPVSAAAAYMESALIANMAREGAIVHGRREYFTGVTFQRATELALSTIARAEADVTSDQLTGRKILDLIHASGLSARDVARAAGMDKNSIYRKMRGDRQFHLNEISALARVLGVRPSDVVTFAEEMDAA